MAARGAQAFLEAPTPFSPYTQPGQKAAELKAATEASAVAENLLRANALEEQIRQQQDAEAGLSPLQQFATETVAGAANSLATVAPAMLTGPAAAPVGIGLAALSEANSAFQEGKDQGLEGGKLAAYTVGQGLIEGVPAAIFQKIPGWSGLEKRLQLGIKNAAGTGFKTALGELGLDTLKEMPEEIITELGHNLAQVAAGTDQGQALNPAWWGKTLLSTVAQTALMGGALGAPALASAAGEKRDIAPPVEEPPTVPQETPGPSVESESATAPEVQAPAIPVSGRLEELQAARAATEARLQEKNSPQKAAKYQARLAQIDEELSALPKPEQAPTCRGVSLAARDTPISNRRHGSP